MIAAAMSAKKSSLAESPVQADESVAGGAPLLDSAAADTEASPAKNKTSATSNIMAKAAAMLAELNNETSASNA